MFPLQNAGGKDVTTPKVGKKKPAKIVMNF